MNPLNWAQLLKLILDNKLVPLFLAIFSASTIADKATALKSFIGAVIDLVAAKIGSGGFVAQEALDVGLLEAQFEAEVKAASGSDVAALKLGDGKLLARLKDLLPLILNLLPLFGVKLPGT